MEDDFDMAGAVNTLGSEMGFNVDDNTVIEGESHAVDDTGSVGTDKLAGAADDSVDTTGTPTDTDPAATGSNEAPSDGVPVAPRTWRPEAAAEFAKLPPVVQQEIIKREEDIFKGIESYKADAAFGKSLKSVLDPYLPTLQQYGISPDAQVADMMDAHYTLAFGSTEQKAALVQRIFKDYKLDPKMLGVTSQQDTSPVWVDPQVEALQKELQEVKSVLTQQQSQQMEAKRAEISAHVQRFAMDPKNVYFEELADDIAHLLRTGAERSVETAYEAAIWRNPAVRAKEVARQQAEKDKAAKAEAAKKAEEARKMTQVNVRSSAKRESATTPLGSIDDTLTETLAKINARSN